MSDERWWGYGDAFEGFHGPYASRRDALRAVAQPRPDYDPSVGDIVTLCRCGRRSAGELVTPSLPSWLLDLIHEEADEVVGDPNGDWSLDDLGPRGDLQARLREAIDAWADDHDLQPRWFVGEDTEEVVLIEEDFAGAEPREVELSDVLAAVDKAFTPNITLRCHWIGADGLRHYRAATVYQGDALRVLGLPRYPTSDDLDEVLDRLPEGWCLEVIEPETE